MDQATHKDKAQTFVGFQIEVEKLLLSRGLDGMWAKQLVDADIRYLEGVFNENGSATEAANEIFVTKADFDAEAAREKEMEQQALVSSKSTKIELKVSPQVCGYLEQLVNIGLWGSTAEEVATSLINRQLDDMMSAGIVTRQ